jgi:single-strand DNA-binding protein
MLKTSASRNNLVWNSVTFIGNLGKDPEMSYTGKGTAYTKFPLAVSQGKDKPPMWLNIVTWKELAMQCNEKLEKGSRVQIEGRLTQNSWEKDGKKYYSYDVVAQTVKSIKFTGSNTGSGGFIEEDDEDDLGDLDDHPF